MGRVGFLYESMKDQLRWSKLSVKKYINIISHIGQILALSDKDYKKAKVKAVKMDTNAIADALLSAYGDGK